MDTYVKQFNELTTDELYDILELRVSVFVVEQQCAYPELDGRDRDALHVFLKEDGKIAAYLRVMDRGVESDDVSIGRVVARDRCRGLGTAIVKEGIRQAKAVFSADRIYIEAQLYAEEFYRKLGFVRTSDVYQIDGIEHIQMLYGAESSSNDR